MPRPVGNRVAIDAVVHLLVPGQGRNSTGRALSSRGLRRIAYAAQIYSDLRLSERGGVVVCSGYKTPGDRNGGKWLSPDSREVYVGIPEADLMRTELLARGLPSASVRVERDSIDTVSNLVRCEYGGMFPDSRAVGIVAQQAQLGRIIRIIAPRVLERDYAGIVVPSDDRVREDFPIDLVSRFVAWRIPRSAAAIDIVHRRAELVWRWAERFGVAAEYNTDSP